MSAHYVRGASLTCAALQSDIQTMLTGAGAHDVLLGPGNGPSVAFSHGGHRFRVAPPAGGEAHTQGSVQEAARHRWRQLAQVLRAKLDAVGTGIVAFDQEFLGYMVLPGGQTVFQASAPAIVAAYRVTGEKAEETNHE
ncbi:hypothetical protein GCM10012320_17520 [Sinomonas cellulolyticus]|uniref:Uncharacterized protein n=1 Tax=Sinomonas cellulolyticus TaxID=2801916 RepID=A0ABS1K2Q7_9MICC|nr:MULTISPECIES: hypothetical protein [Sinomonas]MBL0704576.1 hypothetical protein [Sinomonas cellulolyticus]GHG49434.1 hypothetical protein GCM10012320_17520 [Sinomonas sp. KCTC 49339]